MKKISIFILFTVILLTSCRFDKGDVPQPLSGCVDDSVIHVVNVSMTDVSYSPVDLTVLTGDTIVWTNTSSVPHTVTCDGTSGSVVASGGTAFDSDPSTPINPGETFKTAIAVAGNYTYICVYHAPGMAGTIVVKPRCQ